LNHHIATRGVAPAGEQASDAHEGRGIDQLDGAQIDANDACCEGQGFDDVVRSFSGEVGKQAGNVDRRTVPVCLEGNLEELHDSILFRLIA
jgi:hypothetical protein